MLTKKFFKTKEETEVTFEFSRENVSSVSLCADFNGWQPISMKFHKREKTFRTKIRLPKDQSFHFKYLLDNDEWVNDQQADHYVSNVYGTENSVVVTHS